MELKKGPNGEATEELHLARLRLLFLRQFIIIFITSQAHPLTGGSAPPRGLCLGLVIKNMPHGWSRVSLTEPVR